jgi:hypothetical protein
MEEINPHSAFILALLAKILFRNVKPFAFDIGIKFCLKWSYINIDGYLLAQASNLHKDQILGITLWLNLFSFQNGSVYSVRCLHGHESYLFISGRKVTRHIDPPAEGNFRQSLWAIAFSAAPNTHTVRKSWSVWISGSFLPVSKEFSSILKH